ncbi:MAG: PhoU domain-containing protein [Thermoanaerobaculia bacterium]|nr:PhoU domain-containing protein [Thermoanaerobaculia bacterium]
MLRALINLFRSEDPLAEMGNDFSQMLDLTLDMTKQAGGLYFESDSSPETRTRLYKVDIQVNRLERRVRKHLVAHLSLAGNQRDVPYGLALMSLVKDVERLGDYAKNLAEVSDIHPEPLGDSEIVGELREIRTLVEESFSESLEVFAEFDNERAQQLILEGRNLTKRCDTLLVRIAHSDYGASMTTALVLGSRYYKRIAAHVLNVLSAIVMPLHKLDYYDEDAITLESEEDED